ncbi:MAG TPA: SDR family NAD(P)-dependent oxidoreductase, partial [Acidimicrobiales bacterium]|nr:SDR family NAD(P)-dependent oxidoreductase [Acidimicrobiales bacterium]
MRVLVTGAARAIGAATATELTARGHHVVATARDTGLLKTVEATERIELDVRDEASIRRAVGASGELDAIVNNAG